MRQSVECSFDAADGEAIFYRHWPAADPGAKPDGARALIFLHRGHEHSGRLQHLVDELELPDFHVFGWDQRGHGRNPGARGYAKDFGTLAKDLDCFVGEIGAAHRISVSNMAIVAQSVGSVVAAAWLHDYAPPVRCAVLASPAFRIKLYIPFAIPLLRMLLKIKGKAFIQSYVKAKFLTHDPERQAGYDADPLITRAIAVNILLGLHDAATRIVADAGAIQTPVLMLVSGADWVVEKKPQRRFFEGLSSSVKEWREYPGFYHDTLGEKDRRLPIAAAREFILKQFATPASDTSLLDADKTGFTRREFDALSKPLPALSPKAVNFALTRLSMRTLGRLSEGVRLGIESGFDSGSTLDYVYRNEVHGALSIGRLIDRNYLDSIGWHGIRVRKENLELLLAEAAARVRTAGLPVHIVDIAAGHGRYDIEGLLNLKDDACTALLRDYSEANVTAGRALIAQRGLAERVRFEAGDAFNGDELAKLTPRPTLGVVSGLYELYPDNGAIRESLRGLAAAIPPGGCLLYTNQPWHPQLEVIARVLTSHRQGKSWVMRRRTQAEMDQLVAAAGFEKLDQRIDEWGIFSVSLARRLPVN